MSPFKRLSAGLGLSIALLSIRTVNAQTRYHLTDLKAPWGGTSYEPPSLNNFGQIALETDIGNLTQHSYLWQFGRLIYLGSLAPANVNDLTAASSINDLGQIVGLATFTNDPESSPIQFLWQNGQMKILYGPDSPTGINNSDDVSGESGAGALMAKIGDGTTFLESPATSLSSGTSAINNAGQIVGVVSLTAKSPQFAAQFAALWYNGTRTLLPTLPGFTYGTASAINNLGDVVGSCGTTTVAHTTLWHNAKAIDLGTLPGGMGAGAYGINDNGLIVGQSNLAAGYGPYYGTVYQNGVLRNVNDLLVGAPGWSVSKLTAVNNRGQTVGIATSPAGVMESVLLTPLNRFDFTNEGHDDLLLRNGVSGDLVRARMNGTTALSSSTFFAGLSNAWKLVAAPDLNADGHPDLVFQNQTTGDISYAIMNDGQPLASGYIIHGEPLAWKVVGMPDLNGDGHPDILWQNAQTGQVAYTLLTGKAPYAPIGGAGNWGFLFPSMAAGWRIVGAPDISGDGVPDILWQNDQTGQVAVSTMRGLVQVDWTILFTGVSAGWEVVGTADLNDDGSPDILWQNTRTGATGYTLMSGGVVLAGSGGFHSLFASLPAGWQISGMN